MTLYRKLNGKRVKLTDKEESEYFKKRERSKKKFDDKKNKEESLVLKKKLLIKKIATLISEPEEIEENLNTLESLFNT